MSNKSDNISNEEKVKLTEEGLKAFYEQFGENDMCKIVFLDILFGELYKKDNLHYIREENNTNESNI